MRGESAPHENGGAPRARRKTRTLSVFESLRGEILDARLMPGARLHVASLAARHGVSQGAVREALSRLVADGLVTVRDRRGFSVSMVSAEDLEDVTRTRIEIEGLALRKAIARGDAAWEASVIAAWHELSRATPAQIKDPAFASSTWRILHARFHKALIAACGSPWLLRFRESLFEQSERYRKLSVAYAIGPRDVDREHRELMEAAVGRDADRAVSLLEAHFERTVTVVLQAGRDGAPAVAGREGEDA